MRRGGRGSIVIKKEKNRARHIKGVQNWARFRQLERKRLFSVDKARGEEPKSQRSIGSQTRKGGGVFSAV